MKRRIALLLGTSLLATVSMFAPTPASAHTAVCAGQGTATLNVGFGLPPNFRGANFTFGLDVGGCTEPPLSSVSATGFVNGACGLSSGHGVTNNGHVFAFTSQGGTLYLTGDVDGQVTVVEDPNDAASCANKNAVNFVITGSVALTHTGCHVEVVATAPYGNVYACVLP